ncbi:HAD family hydrolase [bacterium]|nr:MAG: HAD family hydrolase [bacterium]
MKINALIFDFDGLLVDTETPQLRAWQKIYRSFGAELFLEEWVQCLGTSADAFDPIADLRAKTDTSFDEQALIAEYKLESSYGIQKEKIRPGIELLLRQARQLNLCLAVASSSNRSWVNTGLERIGAKQYFEIICTSEDVSRVKPDPELFLLALHRLNLDPEQVIVFEDSPNGIKAAKAAGLVCVAYPNEISSHLDLSHADLIVPHLENHPLSKILHHFESDGFFSA